MHTDLNEKQQMYAYTDWNETNKRTRVQIGMKPTNVHVYILQWHQQTYTDWNETNNRTQIEMKPTNVHVYRLKWNQHTYTCAYWNETNKRTHWNEINTRTRVHIEIKPTNCTCVQIEIKPTNCTRMHIWIKSTNAHVYSLTENDKYKNWNVAINFRQHKQWCTRKLECFCFFLNFSRTMYTV